jgi:hypothetical protein
MLLSHCPNCEYDNQPGERFCAACGVPLDLKPCPVCGKVDSVKATVCTGCGAHFPPLNGEPARDDGNVSSENLNRLPPPIVAPPPSTMRATPLIIVALAAAGIPLLWLFRNTMPVPRVWQASPPGFEVPVTTPSSAQSETLPISPPPQPSASGPALIPVPPKVEEPQVAEPPKAAVVPEPSRTVAKPKAKVPKQADEAPPPPKPAVVSECTEALAAVGLCQRKAAKE